MAIDTDWEKFLGGPTPASEKRLHVSINKQLRIHLNLNAFRLVGKPDAVFLYYNRRLEQIALQPTSTHFPEAFPVKKYHASTYTISAAPFCLHYGIKISATHRFIRPQLDADGRLILSLPETVLVSRHRESKKSTATAR